MNISPLGDIDLDNSRYIRDMRSDVRLEAGDIVFNNTNSPRWIGKTALWEGPPAGFSNHMTRIRLPDALYAPFFARQLHLLCVRGYFESHSRQHVNQASVSLSFLSEQVPLRVAPRAVQELIVGRLNALESKRRSIVDALDIVMQNELPMREALLDHAFVDSDADPKRTLAELVSSPIHYGIVQTGEDVTDGIPTVRAGDLRATGSPRVDTLKRVAKTIESKYEKTRLRGGEVLLSIRGTVGLVGVASPELRDTNVSREIAVIRVSEDMDASYLALYLASPVGQAALTERVRGVAQQGISLRELSQVYVPVPSRANQASVGAEVQQHLDRLAQVKMEVLAASTQADAAHRVLLDRAFGGELVDESSEDSAAATAELITISQEEATERRQIAALQPKRPRKVKVMQSKPMDDLTSVLSVFEREKRPLRPDELLQLSELPGEDVDRFYRVISAAIERGDIVEARPETTSVFLERT